MEPPGRPADGHGDQSESVPLAFRADPPGRSGPAPCLRGAPGELNGPPKPSEASDSLDGSGAPGRWWGGRGDAVSRHGTGGAAMAGRAGAASPAPRRHIRRRPGPPAGRPRGP